VATDTGVAAEQSRLSWGADRVIEMLREYVSGKQPFFVRWDPSEPHLPNILPEPYASLIAPAEIPRWAGFGDTFEGKPYIQAQQLRTWGVEHWGWDRWAPLVAAYLGEIALLDAQVGRVLAELDRLGLRENTLVVYSTDHGDMCGSHGMVDKHYVMYDDVVRVPLIARWPGVIRPGGVCEEFVVHALDLARTFCEVAGGDVPDTFQGVSLLPLFQGTGSTDVRRPDVFAMYHGNQMGLYSQRMVRDRRWKYVWNATAEDELYDLLSDPGERQNRAADPTCAEQLIRLRRRLVTWMEDAGDTLLNQWTRKQLLE
jgi:arylsulfatase A-like enzyme